jgi:hypothetical protein
MTIDEAKHKLEFLKKAYQNLIDEKVDSGKLVGNGVRGEWKAETLLDEAYKDIIEALDMAIEALEQQPCEDCVSREEAIDRMMRKNMPVGEDNTKERFRYLQWLSDLETIKELQSVKPQRSKGRWIQQEDIHKHHYGWFFCSECGAFLMSADGANYCSCCGAEMGAEE